MAVVHQEIRAMLFGRDRIWLRLGNPLDNLDIRDVKFVSAWSALVGADLAFDDDAGFLCQILQRVECLRGNGVFRHDSLYLSAAIAKYGKEQFAALAKVVQPAANGD